MSHSKLQFILVETIWKIYDLPGLLKSVKELFRVTEKLIKDQTEISGLTTINYKEPTWRSTTLLCDKAIEMRLRIPRPASVFCLGSMSDQPVEAWKKKIKWFLEIAISKI